MTAPAPNELSQFVSTWISKPVQPDVARMADVIRTRHQGVAAVLAYGSCIRGESVRDTLIDFYVLTDDLRGVSANGISRLGCALVPPNVYYCEASVEGETLRSKYAVLPISTFADWMKPSTSNPYFWARFSQPSVLVYMRDDNAKQNVIQAIATALSTCFANARATTTATAPLEIWTSGFRATYDTEWRSERQGRADQIVSTYPDYYREAARLLQSVSAVRSQQALRQFVGKLWATARLMKASFTFQGGADYLAWKIERHSGVKVELTDWQRRHPILAAPMMLVALRRKGAIR